MQRRNLLLAALAAPFTFLFGKPATGLDRVLPLKPVDDPRPGPDASVYEIMRWSEYQFLCDAELCRRLYDGLARQNLTIADTEYWLKRDLAMYGNSFCAHLPCFSREWFCGACGTEGDVRQQDWQPVLFDGELTHLGSCAACGTPGRLSFGDYPASQAEGKTRRFSPYDIRILNHGDRVQYVWQIPAMVRKGVRQGAALFWDELPAGLLHACMLDEHQFLFADGVIQHQTALVLETAREDMLGWGVPLLYVRGREAVLQSLHS